MKLSQHAHLHDHSVVDVTVVGLDRKKCANPKCDKYIDDSKPERTRFCSDYCWQFANRRYKKARRGRV